VEPRKRFTIRDLIEGQVGRIIPNLQLETGIRLKYLMAF
jgi:protease IV